MTLEDYIPVQMKPFRICYLISSLRKMNDKKQGEKNNLQQNVILVIYKFTHSLKKNHKKLFWKIEINSYLYLPEREKLYKLVNSIQHIL